MAAGGCELAMMADLVVAADDANIVVLKLKSPYRLVNTSNTYTTGALPPSTLTEAPVT